MNFIIIYLHYHYNDTIFVDQYDKHKSKNVQVLHFLHVHKLNVMCNASKMKSILSIIIVISFVLTCFNCGSSYNCFSSLFKRRISSRISKSKESNPLAKINRALYCSSLLSFGLIFILLTRNQLLNVS